MIKTNYNELDIIKDKKDGMKIKDIIFKHHIKSLKTIYDIIKRNGREKLIANKKYDVDENYFDEINTQNKAYWLGFLYADGYVVMTYNRSGVLKLKLKIGDRNHIEKFRKCLKSTHLIKDLTSKVVVDGVDHISKCSILCIYNTKIVKDLTKHGCMNKKTFKITFPTLRKDLMKHFIRGYFDGDGCIHKKKGGVNAHSIQMIGNEQFINSMQKYLSTKLNSKRIYVYNYGKIKKLIMSHNDECIKFKDFIYEKSRMCLLRKKKIFDKLYKN